MMMASAQTGQTGASHYRGDKAVYVRDMFAGIAHRYDLLNSILSFNQHRAWRRKAVRMASVQPGDCALDVCCGTADLALELARAAGEMGRVAASDFCAPMLRIGRDKAASRHRAGAAPVSLAVADTLRLPYRSDHFDCVTVGFGIRNVADVSQAFREMSRVAKPGGRVVCLEFNQPRIRLVRVVAHFYEMRILPRIGALLSRSEAYAYLPKSIMAFHSREELAQLMRGAGLDDIRTADLNFGSVCIHVGTRVGTRAAGGANE